MSLNTEFSFQCWLRLDTPQSVIDILKFMMPDGMQPLEESNQIAASQKHPFFMTGKWAAMFNWGSVLPSYAVLMDNDFGYYLAVWTNFSDYDDEIEYFLDWIESYIEVEENYKDGPLFLGYKRMEGNTHPTLIYREDGQIVFRGAGKSAPTRLTDVIKGFPPMYIPQLGGELGRHNAKYVKFSPPAIAPGRFLETILAVKRREVAEAKERMPQSELERYVGMFPPALDFAAALRAGYPGILKETEGRTDGFTPALDGKMPALIAEIKRGSPSKGLLSPDFDPGMLARTYGEAGASALSVLTDSTFFGGHVSYIRLAKLWTDNRIPILRKDFIIDAYQLYEARAAGADAALLIVACFADDDPMLGDLLRTCADIGLAALVEVHNAAEMARALDLGATIIGINNRDLTTFVIDPDTTRRLAALVPAGSGVLLVGESGLSTAADIRQLRQWGVHAALIGETLVKNGIPAVGDTVATLFA